MVPIELDCFYQDESLQWIENMKCTPWQADPVSKTLRAQFTEAYNTYTAFEVTYNAYLKSNVGKVEFRYRKDTRNKNYMNGEFKFAVNGKEVMTDYKPSTAVSDWEVYSYDLVGPGMVTLSWIYTKFSLQNKTEYMSAEIDVRLSELKF